MCFVEPHASSFSRRQFLGTGLAAGLAAAAMNWGGAFLLPGVAEGAETPPAGGGPGASGVNLAWFGTNGWEITFGNKTILIDPWFGRFDSGFFAGPGKFNPKTPLKVETALIDQHVKKADQILIGHGHWDHTADIPYIARKTGAMVIGSETHANVLRAAGVPDWDNFEKPFSEGPQDLRSVFGDPANLDLWVKDAQQVSPKSKVVVMKFFESYAP